MEKKIVIDKFKTLMVDEITKGKKKKRISKGNKKEKVKEFIALFMESDESANHAVIHENLDELPIRMSELLDEHLDETLVSIDIGNIKFFKVEEVKVKIIMKEEYDCLEVVK